MAPRARQQDEPDQQLLIGTPQHLVGFEIAGAEIGAGARHGQTRSNSSTVPNRPHGRMLITTSRIRNGKSLAEHRIDQADSQILRKRDNKGAGHRAAQAIESANQAAVRPASRC